MTTKTKYQFPLPFVICYYTCIEDGNQINGVKLMNEFVQIYYILHVCMYYIRIDLCNSFAFYPLKERQLKPVSLKIT